VLEPPECPNAFVTTVPSGTGVQSRERNQTAGSFALQSSCLPSLRRFTPTAVADKNEKTDATKYPKALRHVGLLVNRPPGTAGLLFI
jgi:hypothetical protein